MFFRQVCKILHNCGNYTEINPLPTIHLPCMHFFFSLPERNNYFQYHATFLLTRYFFKIPKIQCTFMKDSHNMDKK